MQGDFSTTLLTVCDPGYSVLCERAYELYLNQIYDSELIRNAQSRLEILENSREKSQKIFPSDYRDAYSHLVLGLYQSRNFCAIERVAMEAIYHEVRLSIEASAILLEVLNQVDSLLAQHTQKYLELVYQIDSLHADIVVCDEHLELPLFDETMHRATRSIHKLHCQLTLENEWEITANRSLNLVNLSKTLLVMQKLCATAYA